MTRTTPLLHSHYARVWDWLEKEEPIMPKLITREEYNKLSPEQQGYVHYMQAAQPGSQLKGLKNPYAAGTSHHTAWKQGQAEAVQQVQDCP